MNGSPNDRQGVSGTPSRQTVCGMWETRDDLPPIRRQRRDFDRGLVIEELVRVTDRKVYETWREADGRLLGRWDWESGL